MTDRVERGLVRALGPFTLAVAIVNVTVGGGIFRAPAVVAQSLGAAAPVAYVVCAVAMGLIVVCFAEAGRRVALTGGPYAYVEVAFGPFVGFVAGVLLWTVGTLAMAGVSILLADAVAGVLGAASTTPFRAATLAVVLAAFAWTNVVGVRQGARVATVMTVAKLVPLLVVVAVGAFSMRGENLAWTAAPSAGGVARAAIVLVFIFAGVESALVPSGEVRDPARTVPRALAVAMVAITLLYLAIHLVAQGVLGADLATETTPLGALAGRVLGAPGRTMLLAGATVSMLGYVSGMILAVPRALYAFARDGFLPRAVAAVHATHRTPHVAIVTQAAVVWLLAVTNTFERLLILANVSTLVLYAACCVAAWELRRRGVRADPAAPDPRGPLGAVVPWLALAVIAALLTSVTAAEWQVVAAVVVVASLLYLVSRSRRGSSVAVQER